MCRNCPYVTQPASRRPADTTRTVCAHNLLAGRHDDDEAVAVPSREERN